MTAFSVLLVLVSVGSFVIGQIVLKRAMEATHTHRMRERPVLLPLTLGVMAMTISFFLMLGLLQHLDLSYLYPFQGLSVLFIALAAAVILREKLTRQMLVGSLLITAGVVLVSLS